jgi:hypothetical protein
MNEGAEACSTRQAFSLDTRTPQKMTTMLLLCGPLAVVFGALYWVMSFHNDQEALDREEWARHGVRT